MNPKPIESRKDIDLLVRRFYEKVRNHGLLGYVFNEIVQDWEIHLVHCI
jgi:hemoglobin